MGKIAEVLLALAGLFTLTAAQSATVTFNLQSHGLPSDTVVYITGSVEQLGSWNPGKVKMDSLGDHRWRKQIQAPNSIPIEYKYTLGSWEREGAQPSGAPLQNLVIQVKSDTTTNDVISFWTNPKSRPVERPKPKQGLIYHRGMKGDGLRDRDVVVWLPPDYRQNSTKRYPVLYMQDGQNVFDSSTSAFGAAWNADEAVVRLVQAKKVPSLIIVGIFNTADRTPEYSTGKKGTAYMNFVVNRLKPFIDKTYRTKPQRDDTFVAGSSMGGLISFMLVWEHPDAFSAAICMSPAFLEPEKPVGKWDYVAEVLASSKPKPHAFFYIDDGSIGVDQILRPGIDKMIAALKTKGLHENTDFVLVNDPGGRHSETDWARRLPNALQLLFNHSNHHNSEQLSYTVFRS